MLPVCVQMPYTCTCCICCCSISYFVSKILQHSVHLHGDNSCLMFMNLKNYPMTVPCRILFLQSVLNSLPCVVKHVYVLAPCVIYASASAGVEWAEEKSMIPSVAYLWLHQTLGLSAGWETGLRQGRGGGGGLVMRSDRGPRERWKGLSQGPRAGQSRNVMKCLWVDLKVIKAWQRNSVFQHVHHRFTGSSNKF